MHRKTIEIIRQKLHILFKFFLFQLIFNFYALTCIMGEKKRLEIGKKPYIAVIIPDKVEGKKFKPIPIEYISGDNKEEICILNESLKIDSTGITTKEVIDDFIKKFLSNWKNFKNNQSVKNYLYMNAPDVQLSDYENLKKKYLELEENYLNK